MELDKPRTNFPTFILFSFMLVCYIFNEWLSFNLSCYLPIPFFAFCYPCSSDLKTVRVFFLCIHECLSDVEVPNPVPNWMLIHSKVIFSEVNVLPIFIFWAINIFLEVEK